MRTAGIHAWEGAMLVLAAIGGGAFLLVSAVVSIRLLLLARRTRGLPELLIGSGLLILGAIGYPLSIVIERSAGAPALQTGLAMCHAVLQILGQGAIALFTLRVFRAQEGWARALVYGFLGGMVALAAWQSAGVGWAAYAATKAGPWANVGLFSLFSLGWAGTEALLYHRKMVKRLALGLADAAAADRIRLWAVSILASFAISVTVLCLRATGHAMNAQAMGIVVGPLGLVSAITMWLAFLPPHRYLRWIEARSARTAV
jgi:hypothetical protein